MRNLYGCSARGLGVIQSLALTCLLLTSVVATAETYSLRSPDGRNEIRLGTSGGGLSYEVLRDGKSLLAPARIGLMLDGKGELGNSPRPIRAERKTHNDVIQMPIYKKSQIMDNGNELLVHFEGGWRIELHARNDGVAYRFATEYEGRVKVLDERAPLVFPDTNLTAYVGYNYGSYKGDLLQNSWESIYQKMPVSQIAKRHERLVYLPLLLAYSDGTHLCVTESDLLDYPGWNLWRDTDAEDRLDSCFARFPVAETCVRERVNFRVTERKPWLVETTGTRTYPWRVFLLADSAAKLVEADIVSALASPSRIGDASWVKPGKVSWEWWNACNLSHVPFKAGINDATYRYFIDFASENGIEYIILDGGWQNPDVHLPELVGYGKERDVGLILWFSWADLLGREEEACEQYAKIGAKGFKIDFIDRDDALAVNFITRMATAAAARHLVLDYHGMFKPTGLSRTYPNILNYEGVHGLECVKWETKTDFPANDCLLVFTRMLAGPMDYTPGAMLNAGRNSFYAFRTRPMSQGTRCHQMALYTLFEAPLQMLCDSPTFYRRERECTAFIARVPTVWDETVALAGTPGVNAAVARRKGDVWYIGAIGNWDAQKLSLDTGFLGGGNWNAEIFSDGNNAAREATDYIRTICEIESGKPLEITLQPGGGWTARLTR
ncbi:MAG: glycoside hydrolase family 97 protein [Kiritimatiellae bacterium]|nr:glycoside hydrolase family 97 protein [Kiritimatiellia bacterium]